MTPEQHPNWAHQDTWDEIQARARAIPPIPHFWAAGAHGGIFRRADLKTGYDLLIESVGGFGHYLTNAIPYLICVVWIVGGLVTAIGFDATRPGGWVGDDQLLTGQAPWSTQHSAILILAAAAAGYLLGFYVWLPLRWYNTAWGDLIALDEDAEGHVTALLRTKVHRLVFAANQSAGYYRGNARDGHIARARILLKNTPAHKDADGNIAGKHLGGLAQCLMPDLYALEAGSGQSTDDPGRQYETLRLKLRGTAEKSRRIQARGTNRLWKLENGLIVLASVMVVAGLLLMLSITGGGEAIVDPTTIGDTVGISP